MNTRRTALGAWLLLLNGLYLSGQGVTWTKVPTTSDARARAAEVYVAYVSSDVAVNGRRGFAVAFRQTGDLSEGRCTFTSDYSAAVASNSSGEPARDSVAAVWVGPAAAMEDGPELPNEPFERIAFFDSAAKRPGAYVVLYRDGFTAVGRSCGSRVVGVLP